MLNDVLLVQQSSVNCELQHDAACISWQLQQSCWSVSMALHTQQHIERLLPLCKQDWADFLVYKLVTLAGALP